MHSQGKYNAELDLVAHETAWDNLPEEFKSFFAAETTNEQRARKTTPQKYWEHLRKHETLWEDLDPSTQSSFEEETKSTRDGSAEEWERRRQLHYTQQVFGEPVNEYLTNLHYRNHIAFIQSAKDQSINAESKIKVTFEIDGELYDSNTNPTEFEVYIPSGSTFKEIKNQLKEEISNLLDFKDKEWYIVKKSVPYSSSTSASSFNAVDSTERLNFEDESTTKLFFIFSEEHFKNNELKIKIRDKAFQNTTANSSLSASYTSSSATVYHPTTNMTSSTVTSPTSSTTTSVALTSTLDWNNLLKKWECFSKEFKSFLAGKTEHLRADLQRSKFIGDKYKGYIFDEKEFWQSEFLTENQRKDYLQEFALQKQYEKKIIDKLKHHDEQQSVNAKQQFALNAVKPLFDVSMRNNNTYFNEKRQHVLSLFYHMKQKIQTMVRGNLDASKNPLAYLDMSPGVDGKKRLPGVYPKIIEIINEGITELHVQIIMTAIDEITKTEDVLQRRQKLTTYVIEYFSSLLTGEDNQLAKSVITKFVESMISHALFDQSKIIPTFHPFHQILQICSSVEGNDLVKLKNELSKLKQEKLYYTLQDIKAVQPDDIKNYVESLCVEYGFTQDVKILLGHLITLRSIDVKCKTSIFDLNQTEYTLRDNWKQIIDSLPSNLKKNLLALIEKLSLHPLDTRAEPEKHVLDHSLRHLRADKKYNDSLDNYTDRAIHFHILTSYIKQSISSAATITAKDGSNVKQFSQPLKEKVDKVNELTHRELHSNDSPDVSVSSPPKKVIKQKTSASTVSAGDQKKPTPTAGRSASKFSELTAKPAITTSKWSTATNYIENKTISENVKTLVNILLTCGENFSKDKNKKTVIATIEDHVSPCISQLSAQEISDFHRLLNGTSSSKKEDASQMALKEALKYLETIRIGSKKILGIETAKTYSAKDKINTFIKDVFPKTIMREYIKTLKLPDIGKGLLVRLVDIGLNPEFLTLQHKQLEVMKVLVAWVKEHNIQLSNVPLAYEIINEISNLIHNRHQTAPKEFTVPLSYLDAIFPSVRKTMLSADRFAVPHAEESGIVTSINQSTYPKWNELHESIRELIRDEITPASFHHTSIQTYEQLWDFNNTNNPYYMEQRVIPFLKSKNLDHLLRVQEMSKKQETSKEKVTTCISENSEREAENNKAVESLPIGKDIIDTRETDRSVEEEKSQNSEVDASSETTELTDQIIKRFNPNESTSKQETREEANLRQYPKWDELPDETRKYVLDKVAIFSKVVDGEQASQLWASVNRQREFLRMLENQVKADGLNISFSNTKTPSPHAFFNQIPSIGNPEQSTFFDNNSKGNAISRAASSLFKPKDKFTALDQEDQGSNKQKKMKRGSASEDQDDNIL